MSKFACAGFIGVAAIGLALAPLAHADDSEKTTPGSPIIRSGERGVVMSGIGEERIADAGKVQGGVESKGAPILVHGGDPASMPTIDGENGVICSTHQPAKTGVIRCS